MNQTNNYTSVVIVAAGQGRRMKLDINKMYFSIKGKAILTRSIEVFEKSSLINEIVVVVNESEADICREDIIENYGFKKVKSLVYGGEKRQNSVFNGLKEVNRKSAFVIIHDGARPFINGEIIENSLNTAKKFGASCVAVPAKDTIKVSDEEDFLCHTLKRPNIWVVQTPQTFKYEIIVKAHENANNNGIISTDDTGLVEKIGIKSKIVTGNYDNIKITTREDLTVAEHIINKREGITGY